jgi:hypothetical protein
MAAALMVKAGSRRTGPRLQSGITLTGSEKAMTSWRPRCAIPLDMLNGEALLPPRKDVVGAEGFEPTTPASQTLCATRLRYAPLVNSLPG